MKAIRWLAILFVVYAAIVTLFETFLGITQPANEGTLRIVVKDSDGNARDRVLAKISIDGRLYVAVNHWPRTWYWQTLDNPAVEVEVNGVRAAYTAVEVTGSAEYDVVDSARPLGTGFRILTGFPPRRILRLDPVDA